MDNKTKKTVEEFIRPPIVTVMGHVDHGKTSILDYIRNAAVQAGEYGGITQHVGAYQIIHKAQKITFIDTPGHAAFSQMRSRGGKAADLVVLVVAADDGVKPQTVEAISHIKAAEAPVIVAINKMDISGADVNNVKQGLAQHEILTEDWGGDVVSVEVSAKTGQDIDKLLDAILAVAELLELKATPEGELEAIVIEARKDKQKGVIVHAIVKSGTLSIGDKVTASGGKGSIKMMTNDKGQLVKTALPGDPVEIIGFKEVPNVGDLLLQEGSELSELAVDEGRIEIIGKDARKTIALVLKADTQGTLEAVKASLADLVASSVGSSYALKFVHSATGPILDSDIMLAQSAGGLVLGFNVPISPAILDLAKASVVPVKSYKAIYELIDDAKDLLEGSALDAEKKIKGRAQIIKTFKLPSGDVILGCNVIAGALKVGSGIFLYEKDPADITSLDEPLYKGQIKKLKIGKKDVVLVGKDVECGVLLKQPYTEDLKGLWIEVFR